MSGRRLLGALAVVLTAVTAEAASFTLTERQVQEAVEAGERSITRDAVGEEWRVRNGSGDIVTVMTPFHRLALASRHAAFRKDPLAPRERARILKEQQDRLVLWVELKGAKEDFARFYAPRLVVGARQVEPTFVQNERTAARGDDGKFLARCLYAFPAKTVAGASRVVLVVRDGDGREITVFPIDLSTMR